VPIVLKSWTLNLLEPSGSVKACNGIALPLTLLSVSAATAGSCKVMRAPAWDFEKIYVIIFNNLLDQTVKIVQKQN
jgi:hypothetical protein